MPYVTIPRDITKVKNKVAFGLTKRQLISCVLAVAVGLPSFWFLWKTIGYDLAFYGMCFTAAPIVICGFFEKDGMPFEKYALIFIRACFLRPKTRYYQTENTYEQLNLRIAIEKEYQQYVAFNKAKEESIIQETRKTDRTTTKSDCHKDKASEKKR